MEWTSDFTTFLVSFLLRQCRDVNLLPHPLIQFHLKAAALPIFADDFDILYFVLLRPRISLLIKLTLLDSFTD
jgi:hypothetical protein